MKKETKEEEEIKITILTLAVGLGFFGAVVLLCWFLNWF
jgi:hypothetical protein